MKTLIYIVLPILAVTTQFVSASEVKYGAEFLQHITSAESDGMGKSLVAYSIGANSLNNNPAGMSYAKSSNLLIGIYKLPAIKAILMKESVDGRWFDYGKYDIKSTEMGIISYTVPVGRFGNLGMSFILNYGGRFIRVNKQGKAINSFPEGDLVFAIGYSHKILQNASLGFDIKSVRLKYTLDDGINIGRTYAANAGFMHQIGPRVRIGAVLQNAGNQIFLKKPDENIPDELRRKFLIGAIYVLRDEKNTFLTLSTDINPPFEKGPRYNLGLELLYIQHIFLRLGYMRSTDEYYDQMTDLLDGTAEYGNRFWIHQGITIGAGVRFGGVEISFARTPVREPILESDEKLRLEDNKGIISLSCLAKL